MEQVFKIVIKDTENATIEVQPTAEGVEIIVKRAEKKVEKPVTEPTNDKLETLRDFCSEKKKAFKSDKTMLAELKRFWLFYSPKMEEWKGKRVEPEKLWARWAETRKGGNADFD